MKLFRVSMTAVKTFYIEARTQAEALELSDEEGCSYGQYDWDHLETQAEEVETARAEHVREHQKSRIFDA